MVIIIMGEVESGRDRVGARVAESLGWEFLDIDESSSSAGTTGSMNDTKRSSPVELLRGVLDSSIYEWRDVVLSCPVLSENEQKHLRDNRPLVKFVHLAAADAADLTLRSYPSEEMKTHAPVEPAEPTPKCDHGILILASSLGLAHIVNAVLTGAVLKKPGNDAA